jgi:HSP90 family molecular chaperone
MITFLLVISFTLHIISFFFIILLYLKLSKVREVETKQSQMMKEMEQAVTAYLLEFKEENEKFLDKLTKAMNHRELRDGKAKRKTANTDDEKEDMLPIYMPKLEEIKDQVDISSVHKKNEQAERNNNADIKKEMQSIMQQALQLHKEGKSIEEIARILEKGKTEIELLLKFRQI